MVPFLFIFSDWALVLLRLVLGAVLIYHGVPKLRNFKDTEASFAKMGFKPGGFWASVVALVEIVGGAALIAGFLTQLVAFLVFIQFAVIIIKLKYKTPLSKGLEVDLLILAAAGLLLTLGSGMYSVDHLLFY